MAEPDSISNVPASAPSPVPAPQDNRGFVRRHPLLIATIIFLVLFAIFIGQNLEPTSIDFLLWSLIDMPKIVLLVLGMPVGALSWELARRAIARS